MEKRVLLTELVDRGSHLRKEITPVAVVTDDGKYAVGTFWDANKIIKTIVAGATDAQDTLKEIEDKLKKEIQDARGAEQNLSNNKADKISNPTEGNFISVDSQGNIVDSGHKHSDYITQHQDLSNYYTKGEIDQLLANL